MSNPYFQFKKFTVWHDRCAMKVGTDGVLLGAWAPADGARRVLDVGTGTGLVALMMAQRSQARITAVEIDEQAAQQARENASRSPWADRIEVIRTDFGLYRPEEKFDIIVSNPPYFADSLRCPDPQRTNARHTDALTYEALLQGVSAMLTEDGAFTLIAPAEMTDGIVSIACTFGLFPARKLLVRTRPEGPFRRVLLTFTFRKQECEAEELLTELERHRYSEAYMELTKEFYLHI